MPFSLMPVLEPKLQGMGYTLVKSYAAKMPISDDQMGKLEEMLRSTDGVLFAPTETSGTTAVFEKVTAASLDQVAVYVGNRPITAKTTVWHGVATRRHYGLSRRFGFGRAQWKERENEVICVEFWAVDSPSLFDIMRDQSATSPLYGFRSIEAAENYAAQTLLESLKLQVAQTYGRQTRRLTDEGRG